MGKRIQSFKNFRSAGETSQKGKFRPKGVSKIAKQYKGGKQGEKGYKTLESENNLEQIIFQELEMALENGFKELVLDGEVMDVVKDMREFSSAIEDLEASDEEIAAFVTKWRESKSASDSMGEGLTEARKPYKEKTKTNTYNKKRKVLDYKNFDKKTDKVEKAKHTEKGEAELTKKHYGKPKKGPKGFATIKESANSLESVVYDILDSGSEKYNGCDDDECIKLLMQEPSVQHFNPSAEDLYHAFDAWKTDKEEESKRPVTNTKPKLERVELNAAAKAKIHQLAHSAETQDTDLHALSAQVADKEEYGNLTPKQAYDALFLAVIGA